MKAHFVPPPSPPPPHCIVGHPKIWGKISTLSVSFNFMAPLSKHNGTNVVLDGTKKDSPTLTTIRGHHFQYTMSMLVVSCPDTSLSLDNGPTIYQQEGLRNNLRDAIAGWRWSQDYGAKQPNGNDQKY